MPKHVLMIDYDHIGKVFAERHRVGMGHIYDVLERERQKRESRIQTSLMPGSSASGVSCGEGSVVRQRVPFLSRQRNQSEAYGVRTP